MIVILLQAGFSLYTIMSTDIATTVESFSYNTFTQTVINRKSNIESFMSASWSNISEVSHNLSHKYNEYLGENDTLTEDEKVEFLNDSVENLVQMITMTGSTGGFIILDDGEDMKYSYSTVYLKSYDALNQTANSNNLQLVRGSTEISKTHGFSLVSNWSYGITLNRNNYPILDTPIQATQYTSNVEYLGYWYISTDVSNENLEVLTFSMPILDHNDTPIGVVGVEISSEYFYKFLPNNEFGSTGSYGYVLADIDDKNLDSLTPTLINSVTHEEFFNLNESVTLNDLNLDKNNLEAEPMLIQVDGLNLCVYFEPLEIYVNNSPFSQDKIWIVGLVDLQNMTAFTQTFWEAVITMVIVSVIAGVVISYIVGKTVAKPILQLSEAVSEYDTTNQITFENSNIIEIDELSGVITQMQESILRSANKTDKILELLDMGVGSFEYEKGSQVVTISGAMYKLLELNQFQGKPIPKDIFFNKLNQVKSNPIKEVSNTFAVANSLDTSVSNTKYYKIDEFEQDDILLGVIEDTTTDVVDLLVLNYERNYDALTGIYNRRAFQQGLDEIVTTKELKISGFIMFDLDNLKYVNDTFGHESGDVYIKSAGTTINSMLSPFGVVGRMSGDEFYAFIYGFDSKEEMLDCIDKLYAQFEADPIEMPNATMFTIKVSGGVAWYGEDSTDLDELQKYADYAMYIGKHSTKGVMSVFDKSRYLEETLTLSGSEELDRILSNQLVDYVFQPIIDAKTGGIFSYEALMRPKSEVLSNPLKLLQIASIEGRLYEVERMVLYKTMSLYKEYEAVLGGSKFSINSISSVTLEEDEYNQFNGLYGDIFSNIIIEMSDQDAGDVSVFNQKLRKLSSLKLKTALDNYSSSIEEDSTIAIEQSVVKIDRSIISNVHVDPSKQAIVHNIIAYCKEHGILSLAEGIETEREFDYLVGEGIDLAQGYYISRPIATPSFDNTDIKLKIMS